MSKTITLRISEDRYEAFKRYAKAENRKISNAIETLALKQLERTQYIGSQEEGSILADKELLGRINKGIRQARAGRGRFPSPADRQTSTKNRK